ncbi:MAG: YihA family ribosome biogenesis GTP-binding protein [Desulfobacteraceae bacterium]|nr:MAG: YihA family ribosome biogenesis GTP-binding protein [Desulfobacteraceae bacterium]
MRITSAEFMVSATRPGNYPPPGLPEIAFAGRSNVGKSTLINVLVNRRHLVKTSSTPGRTQLLNFFNINDQMVFVDLPGYGYAKVPDRVKKDWGMMIETYLANRATLKGVVLILDIRRRAGEEEVDFINWLIERQVPVILILTKADKLSKTQQKKQIAVNAAALSLPPESFLCFSAKTRLGLETVWKAIKACTGDTHIDQAEG